MIEGLLDAAQKVTSSVAFVVGSGWVLMNYVRNRTHVARLQIGIDAAYFAMDDRHFIRVRCEAKNVGQSVVKLPKPAMAGAGPRGSALIVRVLPRYPAPDQAIEAPWTIESAAYDVFQNHQSIEPGLSIVEEKLICQPTASSDAVWVQLRVSAHGQKWTCVAVSTFAPSKATAQSMEQSDAASGD